MWKLYEIQILVSIKVDERLIRKQSHLFITYFLWLLLQYHSRTESLWQRAWSTDSKIFTVWHLEKVCQPISKSNTSSLSTLWRNVHHYILPALRKCPKTYWLWSFSILTSTGYSLERLNVYTYLSLPVQKNGFQLILNQAWLWGGGWEVNTYNNTSTTQVHPKSKKTILPQ